ncbi:MAG: biotin transporter BioY [Clostridia bacterium]|jgi:biotin transport system substrate-specific component|nr:biotin transporter BioY [Clostridia bacterium]
MEQTANKPKFRTVELAYIALGAALIAVCAWITIPFTVPFTMQLFAVFFVLTVLGGRNGTIAIAVYLLLGSIGIPVFSGFKGGFGVLIGMTGGYLVGMLLIGLVYWLMTKLLKPSVWTELIAFAIGLLLCYAFGTLWFSTLNGEKSFYASLAVCVVPFILPDILKLALAYFVGRKLRPLIP